MDYISDKEFWNDLNRKKDLRPQISSIYVKGLTKNSFQEDTKFISMKIVDTKGRQVGHYILNQITGFELKENKIILKTSDEIEITYEFVSTNDAELANEKLNDLINGL